MTHPAPSAGASEDGSLLDATDDGWPRAGPSHGTLDNPNVPTSIPAWYLVVLVALYVIAIALYSVGEASEKAQKLTIVTGVFMVPTFIILEWCMMPFWHQLFVQLSLLFFYGYSPLARGSMLRTLIARAVSPQH